MIVHPAPMAPRLTAVDLDDPRLPAADRARLVAAMRAIHARHFPTYGYVMADVDSHIHPEHNIAHPWLFLLDGQPVGEFIFHTVLNRRVVQLHYLAMDQRGRDALPHGWLTEVTNSIEEHCRREASAHGVELLAVSAEIFCTPRDYRRWRRQGFHVLALEYREPLAGRDWADDPAAEFGALTMIVRPTPAGRAAGPDVVLDAVLSAYLLDYYGLPRDHREVERMFAEAARLGFTELPDSVIQG